MIGVHFGQSHGICERDVVLKGYCDKSVIACFKFLA